MNKSEMIELLKDVANADHDGRPLEDHPCRIAIRALNQCFEDIGALQKYGKQYIHTDQPDCSVPNPYDPQW